MKKSICFAILAVLIVSVPAIAAAKKKPKPKKEIVAGLVFERYPALKGIPDESLRRQNEIADAGHLPRIAAQCDLLRLAEAGHFVRVPDRTEYFYLDDGLKRTRFIKDRCDPKKKIQEDLRYLAPGALEYLGRIAEAYSVQFASQKPPLLKITSLARTVEYQKRLARRNPNARQANCAIPDRCSSHVRGYTFDISVKNMPDGRILWLAHLFAGDMTDSLVFATFEPHQYNFHVMVIPRAPMPKGGAFFWSHRAVGYNKSEGIWLIPQRENRIHFR